MSLWTVLEPSARLAIPERMVLIRESLSAWRTEFRSRSGSSPQSPPFSSRHAPKPVRSEMENEPEDENHSEQNKPGHATPPATPSWARRFSATAWKTRFTMHASLPLFAAAPVAVEGGQPWATAESI